MASTATVLAYTRTLDAKPNSESIVKPGELVDIVEMTPLTLTDRRVYNLLLANAWDDIDKPMTHAIAKRELLFTDHKGTGRLGDSIKRLMGTIVEVRVLRDGEWGTRRVQLLGPNDEPDSDDGMVRYRFPDELRDIICESTIFARLHRVIMFKLSSKYALALYEMVQKRGNLRNKTTDYFTLPEIRGLLGVPKDKLDSWINLKNKAINPAITEVSRLSEFMVTFEPVKGDKKQFTGIRLNWERKAADDLRALEQQLGVTSSKRREPTTVRSNPNQSMLSLFIRGDTLEKAKALCPGYDIHFIESEWQRWSARKEERPDNPDGAFIAFCKSYVSRNPL